MADVDLRREVVIAVARVAFVTDLREEDDIIARVHRVRQLVTAREEDVAVEDSPLAVQGHILSRDITFNLLTSFELRALRY